MLRPVSKRANIACSSNMLHRIITGLWRTSGGTPTEDAHTTADSTRKSLTSTDDLSKARVSLYSVEGYEAVELLAHATLHFDSSEGEPALVVRGYPPSPVHTEEGAAAGERRDHTEEQQLHEEKKNDAVEHRFPCALMCRVRHHRRDMFQWLMTSPSVSAESGLGEEYGLLFEEEASAWLFDRLLNEQLCSDADELSTAWGTLAVYVQRKTSGHRRSESQLVEIASCVECRLLQRPHTLEGYLLITDTHSYGHNNYDDTTSNSDNKSRTSSTDGKDASQLERAEWCVSLSYGEFISTDPDRGLLQWWGPGRCRALHEEESEDEATPTTKAPHNDGKDNDIGAEGDDEEKNGIKKHMFQLMLRRTERAKLTQDTDAPSEERKKSSSSRGRRQGSSSRGRKRSSSSGKRKNSRGRRREDSAEKDDSSGSSGSSSQDTGVTLFFTLLHRVMLERKEGSRISPTTSKRSMEASIGYDDEAFDMSVGEGEREHELEWASGNDVAQTQQDGHTDEEEEERVHLVSEDPTGAVWRKSPQTLLYRHMNVGRDRTFVFRQSMPTAGHPQQNALDVFGLDDLDKLNVVATLGDEKFRYKNAHVNPVSALLHDAETKMLVVGEDRESVYMLDMEKEKIVQKWDTNNVPIRAMMPSTKGGERGHEPTFMAHSSQALFCVDTRMQGAAARTNTIMYSSKVNFTCGATDAAGHIAAGNAVGEIRLYDGAANAEGKLNRAKTRLRGLGDPLLHVSVLKDGSWILGTCQRYLVLFPVKLTSSSKTGFVTGLTEQQRPPPLLLRLRLEDIAAYNLQEMYFTKAEFDDDETAIVTFTNNLAIIWDFVAVKKGNLYAYSIKPIQDYIKDAAFAKTSAGEAVIMETGDDTMQ